MITKIISDGETGVGQAGLFVADELNLKTGGIAKKGYITENGKEEFFLHFHFGLEQTYYNGKEELAKMNVLRSNGVVLFMIKPNFKLQAIKTVAKQYTKPIAIINDITPTNIFDKVNMLSRWLVRNSIRVLYVAGNSEKEVQGIEEFARKFIIKAIKGQPELIY